MTQSINEQIGTLPAIESELHSFEVGRKMFGANSVPRSHDATFEKREGGFDGGGVNVSHDVHAGTVVNLFVARRLWLPARETLCWRGFSGQLLPPTSFLVRQC